ncbi:MAG TPA: DHA2 family efflux MFS transporter permease subunit [Jatrophihabitantaceae bacterium]|nr:DHA2 family efflux MFS transporter permease subunit [Jatrophihabitantaceae bacterium]
MTATLEQPRTALRTATESAASWRRWLALPVILAGTFMITLDFFIVNVAVPAMQGDLAATSTAIEWVVAGYGLAFAAGLILGGRLGDHYGRRRMFATGLELFTLASLACGIAPNSEVLIGARVAQGLAAALMAPQVLSILGLAYPGADRARAFTAYSLTMGFGGIGGQLIGGALIHADVAGLGWRTCFLINLPVGIGALLVTRRFVPESRADGQRRLDLIGAALISAALVAIVLPLVEGRQYGWPAWTWASFGLAGVLLGEFVWWERRLASHPDRAPLVDMSLFGERAFGVGMLATLTYFAGMASFFLVLALYLQQGRGMGPLESGEIFSLLGIGFLVASMAAQALSARLGRQALAIGAIVLALGLIMFRIDAHASTLALIPAFIVDGAGMGIVMAPLTSTVLADLSPRHAGTAAGVLSSVQQVGNAVGVAVIGIVFYGAAGSAHTGAGIVHAFQASIPYLVGFAIAVAVLVQLLPRHRRR